MDLVRALLRLLIFVILILVLWIIVFFETHQSRVDEVTPVNIYVYESMNMKEVNL